MSKSSAKELTQHTSLTSPFRYYPSALPDLNFFFPPHWHNEFELNYIRTGRVAQGETVVFWHTGGATALLAEPEILGKVV